jgi:transcriptional antiterminator NusG
MGLMEKKNTSANPENHGVVRYYALQVRSRSEEKLMRLFRTQRASEGAALHFPLRSLDIRRGGKTAASKLPIFPGYLFLEIHEGDEALRYLPDLRKSEGFFRFLRANNDIVPLKNRDLELVLHFIKKVGPVAGKSKVYFDENSHIVVISGPLSGLEGRIVKADKRKGRAKIRLDLYGDSFCIDLAFEHMDQSW